MEIRSITIPAGNRAPLCALLAVPKDPHAGCVLAHGAGAGMSHPFMEAMAAGLALRGVASLRYQFPYMQSGSKRPDPPAVCHAAVRAAAAEAARALPGLPLFAGGKSFGGRMTSQAQADCPLPEVRGLVFMGFPLHPAGRHSRERARHLDAIQVPMLFLQGTRDALAQPSLVDATIRHLGRRARLESLEGADHAFHVLARSGRTDLQVQEQMLDAMREWIIANS